MTATTRHRTGQVANRRELPRPRLLASRCTRWWVAVAVASVVLAVAPSQAAPTSAPGPRAFAITASGDTAHQPDSGVIAQGAVEAEPGTRPPPESLPQLPDNAGDILPYPNSGTEPTHAGDRGGWLQTLVLVGLLGALGAVGTFAWRDGQRKRAAASRPLP